MRLLPQLARMHFVALLIATPAVIGALGLSAIDAGPLLRPASRRDDAAPAGSLADAIVEGDVERAYAFIRAGQNPNTPIAVRHDDLTGGRQIMVSPLLLAVASHRDNVVAMLLSFGVRMELPGNKFALCLANQVSDEEIARMIVRHGGSASTVECPEAKPGPVPPLLALVE